MRLECENCGTKSTVDELHDHNLFCWACYKYVCIWCCNVLDAHMENGKCLYDSTIYSSRLPAKENDTP